MNNVKEKNTSSAVGPQVESGWSTEEKAQYEVYKNGNLSRETIAKWIKNDLSAVASFVHGIMQDKEIFNVLVDAFYARYEKLHDKEKES